MNKPLFGLILGAVLGIFDGLSALLSAPEARAMIVGIVIGSTIKGLIAGYATGWFAKKVNSLPLGILFGTALGFALAGLVVLTQPGHPYIWEILLPGALIGAIVGYSTQKHRVALAGNAR